MITGEDLLEACRLANRTRIQHPGQVLINTHGAGLLDKAGDGKGSGYSISTVGENLVAMALPANGTKVVTAPKKKPAKKPSKSNTKKSKKKA